MLGFGSGKWACSVSQLFCLFTIIFLCKMQLFFKICKRRRALKRKSCESIWQSFSPWMWLQFWSLSFVCQSCLVDHLHPIWLFVYLVWRLSETAWFLTSKSSYRFVTFWIETVCLFESMAHSQSWKRNWCWSLDLCRPYSLLQGLWKRLINLSGAEDPLSSSEYGTIFGTYQPVFCSSFHEVSTVRKVDVFVKGSVGVGVLVVVIKWASEFLKL